MATCARASAMFLLLSSALLLVISGCSQDTPLSPEQGDLALKAGPEEPEDFFIQTYDTGRNVGGWSFYTNNKKVVEDDGGNPGGYLHDDHVVSFAPHPGTRIGLDSIFTGDYRTRNVTSLGIDIRCIDYEWDITSRHLTLVVMNDNGTPGDFEDDWGAYFVSEQTLPSKYVDMKAAADKGDNAPGWRPFDFEIPSQADQFPAGWQPLTWVVEYPMGGTWSDLMADVSYVQYYFGDPTMYYIIQAFDLGLDNPRISFE